MILSPGQSLPNLPSPELQRTPHSTAVLTEKSHRHDLLGPFHSKSHIFQNVSGEALAVQGEIDARKPDPFDSKMIPRYEGRVRSGSANAIVSTQCNCKVSHRSS